MIIIDLGIDLGTCNSMGTICIYDSDKSIKRTNIYPVRSDQKTIGYGADGEYLVPSFVFYNIYGEKLDVGQSAKSQGQSTKKQLIYNVKRIIGKTYEDALKEKEKVSLPYDIIKAKDGGAKIKIGSAELLPQEVAAEIIQKIYENTKNFLRQQFRETDFEINYLMITHPAYFSANQQSATLDAAKIAAEKMGIKINKIITIAEPVAAAACCAFDELLTGMKNILVFDLGAGTLDIALVEYQKVERNKNLKNFIKTKDVGGVTSLGGIDIDKKILDWYLDQLDDALKENGITKEEFRNNDSENLLDTIEKSKIKLSKVEYVKIWSDRLQTSVTLTREKLEQLISPFLDECREKIKEALKKAEENHHIKKSDISKVIPIGGPTKMPIIRKILKDELGDIILDDVNPMQSVSQGSIKGNLVIIKDKIKSIPGGSVQKIVSRAYGLEINNVFKVMIEIGRTIPVTTSPAQFDFIINDGRILIHPVQEYPEKKLADPNMISCQTLGQYYFPIPDIGTDFRVKAKIQFEIKEDEKLHVIVDYKGEKMELRPFKEIKNIDLKITEDEGTKEIPVNIIWQYFNAQNFRVSGSLSKAFFQLRIAQGIPKNRIDDSDERIRFGLLVKELSDTSNQIYQYILVAVLTVLEQNENDVKVLVKKIYNKQAFNTDEQKIFESKLSDVTITNILRETGGKIENARDFILLNQKTNELQEMIDKYGEYPGPNEIMEWIENAEQILQVARKNLNKLSNNENVEFYNNKIVILEEQINRVRNNWAKVIDKTMIKRELFAIPMLSEELKPLTL